MGRSFYGLHYDITISHSFNEYFPLYWMVALTIIYCSIKYGINAKLSLITENKRFFSIIRFLLLIFPALTVLYLVMFCTGGVPHIEDEFTYLYQAKAISNLQYPGPIVPTELENTMQAGFIKKNNSGYLSGIYPIGYPIALAPFTFLGLEKFFPPLLTLLNTLLLFQLIEKIFKKRDILPYLLINSSIFYIFYNTLFFSQSLCLSLVTLILLRRTAGKTMDKDYLLCALLFIVRPTDGTIMFFCLALFQFLYYKPRIIHPILAPSALFALSIHLINNRLLTGELFGNPYHNIFPFLNYGFSSSTGLKEPFGFNLWQAIKNQGEVLIGLNETLFGWPFLSLLPILILLVHHLKNRKLPVEKNNFFSFCIMLGLSWFIFYFCYFFPCNIIGPRFHYPLFPIFLYLSVAGINLFPKIRLMVFLFCLIGFTSIMELGKTTDNTNNTDNDNKEQAVIRLINYSSVLSFPFEKFQLQKKDHIYIIDNFVFKEKENTDELFSYQKDFFDSFYYYNDPFKNYFLFIHKKDYSKNTEFFQKKFAKKIIFLNLKSDL